MSEAPVPSTGASLFSLVSDADAAVAAARSVADRLTIPITRGLRRTSGQVSGSAAGSSIDFQDHRPYMPGDDPRHIDWQAYARSGHYTMKLYREEVRPLVDLVIDVSPSMALDAAKARRSLELAAFCLEAVQRSASSLHVFTLAGGIATPLENSLALHQITLAGEAASVPQFELIPWRAASLRIVVSDLLFAANPEAICPALASGNGRGIIFAPYCAAESDPDWLGNTELADCESTARQDFQFSPEDMRRYRATYANHFALWQDATRRCGIALARISSESPLVDALQESALGVGAVEIA
ncbi:MAG: DUF58 domain-containing protein [Verrucomicrobia bacterium]|nr:DUF58 domain-containing protein [Verrucomicrobiota bacterium]